MPPRAKQPEPETPAGVMRLTLTIPAAVVARLDEHAQAERRSRSNAAALLLERALADSRRAG